MPITGTGAADLITDTGGNDVIEAGAGDDTVESNAGADMLYGGDGDDEFLVLSDNSSVYGGAGSDYIDYSPWSEAPTGLIEAGAGDDFVQIFSSAGHVAVHGQDGTDTLSLLWLGGRTQVSLAEGTASIEGLQPVSFDGFEILNVSVGAGSVVHGGDGSDSISTVEGGSLLVGGGGDDHFNVSIGFGGVADTVDGGSGNDQLTFDMSFGDSNRFAVDPAGNVHIEGILTATGIERFVIIGPELDSVITLGAGQDTVIGGGANDLISGGAGDDVISGTWGNDTLSGDHGNDLVGDDSGRNILSGGQGADTLQGGEGADTLNGGWGYDSLSGGMAADFFFHLGVAGHGADWVMDYSAAENDRLTFGITSATGADFHVAFGAAGRASGDAGVDEAFVVYRPTGQILWVLVDGAEQEQITLRVAGVEYDLLA
ncbi:MAG: hypothetical protein IAE87_14775 [Rhodobacteraceae bacterium]|jgi:Ca2+-binding RTX toxin-like protein|nr:hypothetical protein [Paracoccaceae bacterium]